jgi:hypothetical protein
LPVPPDTGGVSGLPGGGTAIFDGHLGSVSGFPGIRRNIARETLPGGIAPARGLAGMPVFGPGIRNREETGRQIDFGGVMPFSDTSPLDPYRPRLRDRIPCPSLAERRKGPAARTVSSTAGRDRDRRRSSTQEVYAFPARDWSPNPRLWIIRSMVSPDPAVTLADLLEARIDLLCRCRRCGHEAGVPAGLVAAKLGAATPVAAVASAGALYCRACGRKDVGVRPNWGEGRPPTTTAS